MVDPVAAQFFRIQKEDDPSNAFCCDCSTLSAPAAAQWASVSFGIYLSIGAAGVHRSLGVKTSCVLSTTMDSWKPIHLRMMELGGNRRFHEFLRLHGVPDGMPIRQKYRTRAADWYRENLRAIAEGTTPPVALSPGTGYLPGTVVGTATDALLDDVFAFAPSQQANVGGRPHTSHTPKPSKQRTHSQLGLEIQTDCWSSSSESSVSSPSSPSSSSASTAPPNEGSRSTPWLISNLLIEVHRTFKGHHTARRLRSTSTGSMVGFGTEACGPTTRKES